MYTYIDILLRLRVPSEGNATKNGETAAGFSLTTMLQYTNRFWSKISQPTTWQHWSIPHTFQPGFSWFLPVSSTRTSMKGIEASAMLLTSLRIREELKRISENGFQECFQHLYSRWQKCMVAQGGDLEEMTLKWYILFLINKAIPGIFWTCHIEKIRSRMPCLSWLLLEIFP